MANTTGGDKLFVVPWTTDRHLKIPAAIPAATTIYYSGQAVGRNASGNMVQMDDTAKAEFIGVLDDLVRTQVDTTDLVQTNGLLGDKMFVVDQPQLITALISSAVAGDEGRKVFWLYNNQVSYLPGASCNYAGTVWFVKDSTHVTILPPWMPSTTGGSNKGQYTTAATGPVTLTKWDVNKDVLMPLTSGAVINLPAAASVGPGDSLAFINLSANSSVPTLTAAGSDTINGAATVAMSGVQYAALTLRSNGVNTWYSAAQNVSGTLGATTFTGNVGLTGSNLVITDAAANALAVGPNGTTNPVLTVDGSVASAATGIAIQGEAAGSGVKLTIITSGTNEDLLIVTAGTGGVKITSPGASALAVGRLGGTTPALQVDASTATCVTGMKLKAAASGGGFAVSFIGGTNEVVTVDTNGSGALTLQSIGTGNVLIGSGCLVNGGTGGIGYGVGVGGAVSQITSRTTAVTLNKLTGAITLVSAAGTATPQSFTVTNSTVAAADTVVVSQKSGTDLNEIFVTNVAAGSFKITFFTTGGTTTETPVFSFTVMKGAIT
jgi:hypothetical protein